MIKYELIIGIGSTGERRVVLDKPVFRVGRSSDADIVISNKNVSNVHFSLLIEDSTVELIDLGSTNGTFVNRKKVRKCVLNDGDVITIADQMLSIQKKEIAQPLKTSVYPLNGAGDDNDVLESFFRKIKSDPNLSDVEIETVHDSIAVLSRNSRLFQSLHTILLNVLPHSNQDDILKELLLEMGKLLDLELFGIFICSDQQLYTIDNNDLVIQSDKKFVSFSVLQKVIETKQPLIIENITPESEYSSFKSLLRLKIRSLLCFPVVNRSGQVLGAFYCVSQIVSKLKLLENDHQFLKACSSLIALVLENCTLIQREKESAYSEATVNEEKKFTPVISRLKQERENFYLKLNCSNSGDSFFVCNDETSEVIRSFAEKAARTGLPALITGETGVGKTLLAKEIHKNSSRPGALVTIDCTTIPPELIESELFGHEKGSFTGAYNKKSGKVSAAQDGTLFIDEIGELAPGLQGKLLRLLQSGEYEPIGSTQTFQSSAKLIIATNRDLKNEVAQKRFREDLYFRLNVLSIEIPPLRKRHELLSRLTLHFLSKYSRFNSMVKGFSEQALSAIHSHSWPGNIRELENAIMRALVNATEDMISVEDLAIEQHSTRLSHTEEPLIDIESLDLKSAREHIDRILIGKALSRTARNVSQASKLLNISRNALMELIKKYEI